MKLLEIRHYVKSFLGGPPAFVLLMSDGKEYISYEDDFIENSELGRIYFIGGYDRCCVQEVDMLLNAPPIAIEELEKGECMFEGYGGELEFDHPLPKLKDASWMFLGTKIKKFNVPLPSLEESYKMFSASEIQEFTSCMPSLKRAHYMFYKSKLEKFNANIPGIADTWDMFGGTPYEEKMWNN